MGQDFTEQGALAVSPKIQSKTHNLIAGNSPDGIEPDPGRQQ
jgi:hypothetical protein